MLSPRALEEEVMSSPSPLRPRSHCEKSVLKESPKDYPVKEEEEEEVELNYEAALDGDEFFLVHEDEPPRPRSSSPKLRTPEAEQDRTIATSTSRAAVASLIKKFDKAATTQQAPPLLLQQQPPRKDELEPADENTARPPPSLSCTITLEGIKDVAEAFRPEPLDDFEELEVPPPCSHRRSISPGRAAWERLRTPSPEMTYTPTPKGEQQQQQNAQWPSSRSSLLFTSPSINEATVSSPQHVAGVGIGSPRRRLTVASNSPHQAMPPSPMADAVAAVASPQRLHNHFQQQQRSPPKKSVLATSPKAALPSFCVTHVAAAPALPPAADEAAAAWRHMRDQHQARSQVPTSPFGVQSYNSPQFYQQQQPPQWQQQQQQQQHNLGYHGGDFFAASDCFQNACGHAAAAQVLAPAICEYEEEAWDQGCCDRAELYIGRVPAEWDESDIRCILAGAGIQSDCLWKFKWLKQQQRGNPMKSAICEFSNYATADIALETLVACGNGHQGGLVVRYAGKPHGSWATSRQQQHQQLQQQHQSHAGSVTRGRKGKSRRRSTAAIAASQPQL